MIVTTRILKEWGRYCFHRCLSTWGGYLPWPEGGGTYLGQGEGIPALDGGGGTYLGWVEGVPTLDRGGGTYFGQG